MAASKSVKWNMPVKQFFALLALTVAGSMALASCQHPAEQVPAKTVHVPHILVYDNHPHVPTFRVIRKVKRNNRMANVVVIAGTSQIPIGSQIAALGWQKPQDTWKITFSGGAGSISGVNNTPNAGWLAECRQPPPSFPPPFQGNTYCIFITCPTNAVTGINYFAECHSLTSFDPSHIVNAHFDVQAIVRVGDKFPPRRLKVAGPEPFPGRRCRMSCCPVVHTPVVAVLSGITSFPQQYQVNIANQYANWLVFSPGRFVDGTANFNSDCGVRIYKGVDGSADGWQKNPTMRVAGSHYWDMLADQPHMVPWNNEMKFMLEFYRSSTVSTSAQIEFSLLGFEEK